MVLLSLPKIFDDAQVAYFTLPSWCMAEGTVLVDPGGDRSGMVWLCVVITWRVLGKVQPDGGRQPVAVPELPNNKTRQSPQQSHAEDHTELIEVKSRENHRQRTGRLQSRKEYHRADLQPTHST